MFLIHETVLLLTKSYLAIRVYYIGFNKTDNMTCNGDFLWPKCGYDTYCKMIVIALIRTGLSGAGTQ